MAELRKVSPTVSIVRHAAPRAVRIAGAVVGVQGLAAVAFAIAVLIRALVATQKSVGNEYAESAYFAILAAGVIAIAVGLLSGRRWARTPAAVLQLLLLGVAWYVLGPSGQVLIGVAVAILCLAILILLFTAPARAWAVEENSSSNNG